MSNLSIPEHPDLRNERTSSLRRWYVDRIVEFHTGELSNEDRFITYSKMMVLHYELSTRYAKSALSSIQTFEVYSGREYAKKVIEIHKIVNKEKI